MRVRTGQRDEWTLTSWSGRVLVTAGRIVGGKRVTLNVKHPTAALDARSARALAAWLLVQANDMEAEASRKVKQEAEDAE